MAKVVFEVEVPGWYTSLVSKELEAIEALVLQINSKVAEESSKKRPAVDWHAVAASISTKD